MGLAVLLMVWRWFEMDEVREWMGNTWEFAKLLVPLLYGGVFVVGFVSTLLPQEYVSPMEVSDLWDFIGAIRDKAGRGFLIAQSLFRIGFELMGNRVHFLSVPEERRCHISDLHSTAADVFPSCILSRNL